MAIEGFGGAVKGAWNRAGDWFNENIVKQEKKPMQIHPVTPGAPLQIPTQMGPPGGATPKIDPSTIYQPEAVVNPYAEAAKKSLAEQLALSGALGAYGEAGRKSVVGLMGQLQSQAAGQAGPGSSLAQALLQQGLTQNIAGVRSQLASQRGLSPAIRARLAAQQTAALGGQTAQQAGIMGLQQQLAAQQQLGQLGMGAATLGAEGLQRGFGQISGADIAMSEQEVKRQIAKQQTDAAIAAANQAAATADKARTVGAATSILKGASDIGAAYVGAAHGGRIDGEAPYAGDTPKNDIVPAQLSPGEIVIPRSAAGSKKAAKAFIEALDDWDEEPSYGKVLKARQKKNYADGGKVEFPLGGPYAPMNPEKIGASYDQELPVAQKMKQSFDQFLTERVVEPLAQRGYPTLGAALATVPSVAADVMIPGTTGELQAGVIPFPKGKAGKKVADKAKELSDELPANIKRFFNFNESVEEKMYRKAKEKPMSKSVSKMTPEEIAKLTPEEKAIEGLPLTRGEKLMLEPELQFRSDYEEGKTIKAEYDRKWRETLEKRKGNNALFASEFGEEASLGKGAGWYDVIGGQANFKRSLDEVKKLNKGNETLVNKINYYQNLMKDFHEKTYEPAKREVFSSAERVYIDIIDYIDRNLDDVLLPKLTKVK